MLGPLKMPAHRLLELIGECEADYQLARRTGQREWAATQKARRESLNELARRCRVNVTAEATHDRVG